MIGRRTILLTTFVGILLLLIGGGYLYQTGTTQALGTSVNALKQHPAVYALILILVTAVMLPPFLVIILGGFLYGAIKGALISSIAYLIGATVSFYLGRHFGQATVARIAARQSSIHALNHAIERKGLIMVLLARLALVFPYNILNVVLGTSHVSLKHYMIGTLLGSLPIIIANSIIGETAPGLLDILQGKVGFNIDRHMVIGFGLLILITLVWVVRWSGKQLQQEIAVQSKDA